MSTIIGKILPSYTKEVETFIISLRIMKNISHEKNSLALNYYITIK